MEAIIRDGGRQYRVQQGSTVDVDYRELEPGSRVEFEDVLLINEGEGGSTRVGQPRVEGAKVVGKVVGQVKGPKLIVMHFRRRKNSKTRFGHRQRYTKVQIETIEV
jgi:large subunit ribosomal protein L21